MQPACPPIAQLVDGRAISVPLAWSWRLAEATQAQRAHFRLIGTGQGVHWPDVDEDISGEGMLYGTLARRLKLTPAVSGPRARRHVPPHKRLQPTRKRAARGLIRTAFLARHARCRRLTSRLSAPYMSIRLRFQVPSEV